MTESTTPVCNKNHEETAMRRVRADGHGNAIGPWPLLPQEDSGKQVGCI
ncbi:hypothetical protein [Methanoregula sp.]|nr:hypothetical protein [Methanoregula sp.]MDD1686260.1 hypothetical protein [Methanoregula sp.]